MLNLPQSHSSQTDIIGWSNSEYQLNHNYHQISQQPTLPTPDVEPTAQLHSSAEFIRFHFPNTIRENEIIDEEVSLSNLTAPNSLVNSNLDNTLAPISRSRSNTTLSSQSSDDLNVLFWNIGGYRLGRTSLD